MIWRGVFPLLALGVSLGLAQGAERPNVIVILADDMGFSDLGCYGGEISTPNLDALAKDGLRFSQFSNSARCCPTRASLMTGLHPHQAGVGYMTEGPGESQPADATPAYQGYLNKECVTVAEVLKGSGYTTLMTGKWHLGQSQQDRWPLQRGFDRFYGCLSGAVHYFYPAAPRGITSGNEPDTELKSTTDRPYYTTDAFTDHAIGFIGEAREKSPEKPFFLYLAYNAPHWPMQAHPEDIAKYRGRYRAGWDKLREERYRRQVAAGLIRKEWPLSPRDADVPAWDSLPEEKQDEMDLRMAIYAAMVDRMDQNIGKLVDSLKKQGVFDNTLIVFLADNGACAENGVLGNGDIRDVEKRNAMWNISYGKAWANLSSTPFRLYKHFAHEGGSATPFIAQWPKGITRRDGWVTEPAQVIDLMPTFVELAGAQYPKERGGHAVPALPGVSLAPLLKGKELRRTGPMFMEHEGNAFIRDGAWKLEARGLLPGNHEVNEKWELHNMADDRTEQRDLKKDEPERAAALYRQWRAWADATGVYPKKIAAKEKK